MDVREGKPNLVVAFSGGRGTWHTWSLAGTLGIAVVKIIQSLPSQAAQREE